MNSGAVGSVGTPLNSDATGSAGTSSVIVTETSATQTDVILPQRVDAYWHCCLRSTTVIDKPRTVAKVSEVACDAVEPETEAVFYDQGEVAKLSASRDPRQRNCADVGRKMMSEDMLRTPMTLPTERYDLTPVHGSNDSGMFNFEVGSEEPQRRIRTRCIRIPW